MNISKSYEIRIALDFGKAAIGIASTISKDILDKETIDKEQENLFEYVRQSVMYDLAVAANKLNATGQPLCLELAQRVDQFLKNEKGGK